jgi:transcriptional regulator with XRE-family HTH domain
MFNAACAIPDAMHEGNKIKELLASAGKTASDFARACGVTPSGVQRYLTADEIGKHAWETCRRGLEKLGIDPRQVRPSTTLERVKPEDLRRLLVHFSQKQLPYLREILEASSEAQYVLRAIIVDRIERSEN